MLEIIIVFIFGLSLGSFSNVCIYRLPLSKSLISPLSSCPHCNAKIKYVHNIPIISYLLLKGKSSCCHKKISLHYPLVEFFIGITAVCFFIMDGFTFEAFFSLLFIMGLVILFVTDLEHYIIPNAVTYSLSALAIIISILRINPWLLHYLDSLIGGIVSGALLYLTSKIYFWVRKKEGMGMGDIKLLGALGLWLGWQSLFFIIIVSSLLGIAGGLSAVLLSKMQMQGRIPYGCFLIVTTVLYMAFISSITSFYQTYMFV